MKSYYCQVVRYRAWILLFVGSWIALSCNTPKSKELNVFRYNSVNTISSLDPAFAKSQEVIWATKLLYNTLVETDTGLAIRPSVARSWEVSDDHLTYTFHLRTDIRFHDNEIFPGGKGRRLVAGDVVFSLQRLLDPATASPGAWLFNGRLDPEKGFKALDDSTFQLTLFQPFHPVLGILSMQYCSIVPFEVVGKYGKDFRNHPCGSGPFQFFLWDEGQALVLHRNPHYFEKDSAGQQLPYLEAVQISFLESKASEFLLFRQGQLDFMNDIEPSFKDEVLTKQGTLKKEWEGKIVLSKHAYLNTEYLGCLMDSSNPLVKNSPIRIKKIRKAINYGIDRTKMMTYLRNGIGTAALSGFVPAGLPSYNPDKVKGYPYSPATARTLLKEAGFPGGKGLPVIKLISIPAYADLANYVANQLQEIGITVQVEVVQKGVLLEQTSKSLALFFRASWIADYPDAESYLTVFYGNNPAPPNYTRYHNATFDRLYEQALKENDDSIRYDLYQQMDRIVTEDAAVVPLFYDEVIRLVQPNVTGLYNNGMNLLELRWVKKVKL